MVHSPPCVSPPRSSYATRRYVSSQLESVANSKLGPLKVPSHKAERVPQQPSTSPDHQLTKPRSSSGENAMSSTREQRFPQSKNVTFSQAPSGRAGKERTRNLGKRRLRRAQTGTSCRQSTARRQRQSIKAFGPRRICCEGARGCRNPKRSRKRVRRSATTFGR
jgi:hypothetical protein